MNWLKSVINWANNAFSAAAGALSNPLGAITALWHYISSVHSLVSWLFGNPLLQFALNHAKWLSAWFDGMVAARDALHRLAAWINATWIRPAVVMLSARIAALRAWTALQLRLLTAYVNYEIAVLRAFTVALVAAERAQRIKAVAAEHAAMLAGLKATLATVQRQASTGYNSTRHARVSTITGLAQDLQALEPALDKILPKLLADVIDIENIDDPVLRWLANKALSEVLAHTGADHVSGSLLGVLISQLAGAGPPKTLSDVEKDVGERLNALEQQWADFMKHGGPEVENAGDQWKGLTGVIADVSILAVFGLAVTEPAAWATGVSDTIGVAGNAALDVVVKALRSL